MDEIFLANQEQFLKTLEALFKAASKHPLLKKLKERSWNQFLQSSLPSQKDEVFRYVRLRKLYENKIERKERVLLQKETIQSFIDPESKGSCAVFVDGCFEEGLSSFENLPNKVLALGLEEASLSFGALLQNHFSRMLQEEKDPFALLNTSLYEGGLFLMVPPKTTLSTPLQLLHVVTKEGGLLFPRCDAFLGKESEITVTSRTVGLDGEPCFISGIANFIQEEGSSLHYSRVNLKEDFKEKKVFHFEAVRADLKKDAKFHSCIASTGRDCYRDDYRVSLRGENGEASLNGVAMLSDSVEHHTHVFVGHFAPHCRSNQLFKAALDEKSRSSFEGKIFVAKEADKTDAFQLNNNLILSEGAEGFSKPNLEIFADDVKASHGSTVGQLDLDELFYMKARGLSEAISKNLLVQGFCREVIESFPEGTIKHLAEDASSNYLKTYE